MIIDLTNLENEIRELARDILNKAGTAANEDAVAHIKSTYNTRINPTDIKTVSATKDNLVFKIEVRGRSVSLVRKVIRVTNRGVSVLVKRGSPKFIRSAFVAPWQKGQSRRWLFLRKGKLRRALYTIGLARMYGSRGTMRAIAASINKTLRKIK